MAVGIALCGSALAAAAQAGPDPAPRIDALVRRELEAGRAVGLVVAVGRGDAAPVVKAYGRADVEWDVPMAPDAVFEIGSTTKQFTAAAILRLRDAGKLALDDDITKWLPDFDARGKHIILRQLLDHTSGIHDFTETAEFPALVSNRVWPRDSAYALIRRQPFDFDPGTSQLYSSSGYFLLGLVIERASGRSYEEYVEQEFFAPLGMTRSMYCNWSENVPRRAHGYALQAGGIARGPTNIHTWSFAAGGLCSTAADLLTWLRALHGGRVLSPASLREMTTASTLENRMPLRYGFGLGVATFEGGRRVIWHGGVVAGFRSEAMWYPDAELGIVVLGNASGGVDPEDLAGAIGDALLPAVDRRDPVFTGDLAPFLGSYRGRGLRGPLTITVSRGPDGLLVAANGSPPRPLAWVEGRTFRQGDTHLIFGGTDGQQAGELGFNPAKGVMLLLSRQ